MSGLLHVLFLINLLVFSAASALPQSRPLPFNNSSSADEFTLSANGSSESTTSLFVFRELMQAALQQISIDYPDPAYWSIILRCRVEEGCSVAPLFSRVAVWVDDPAKDQSVSYVNDRHKVLDFRADKREQRPEKYLNKYKTFSYSDELMHPETAIQEFNRHGISPPYRMLKIFWRDKQLFSKQIPSEITYSVYPQGSEISAAVLGTTSLRFRNRSELGDDESDAPDFSTNITIS